MRRRDVTSYYTRCTDRLHFPSLSSGVTIYASITYNIAHEYTRLRVNTILKCTHTMLEEKSLVDNILSFCNKFVSDEFSLNFPDFQYSWFGNWKE